MDPDELKADLAIAVDEALELADELARRIAEGYDNLSAERELAQATRHPPPQVALRIEIAG